jgi:5-formyltetrahydrofolate cyclo-ligase
MQKQPLRKEIKSKLKQISDEKIKLYSDNVFLKLAKKVDDFQVRFVYFSTEKEIQTDKIIKLLMQK